MNLPDSAITFLGAFRGIFSAAFLREKGVSDVYHIMPMIHCYCFTREMEPDKAEADIRKVREFSVILFYGANAAL